MVSTNMPNIPSTDFYKSFTENFYTSITDMMNCPSLRDSLTTSITSLNESFVQINESIRQLILQHQDTYKDLIDLMNESSRSLGREFSAIFEEMGQTVRALIGISPELKRQLEYIQKHKDLFKGIEDMPIDEALETIDSFYQKFNNLPPLELQISVCCALFSMPLASAIEVPETLKNLAFWLFAFFILHNR